jgi:hypothetical protein
MSHYDYLNQNLPAFFDLIAATVEGAKFCAWQYNGGIVTCHGDKCYGYREDWEEAGIPFEKGVAIYLLSYCKPFSDQCRETKAGWVKPCEWVISVKDQFINLLP